MTATGYVAVVAGAGVLAALLSVVALLGSLGALLLSYLTPLPLFVAGLMLGAPAAQIAVGTMAIVLIPTMGWPVALAFVVVIGAPVAWVVQRALTPVDDGAGGRMWMPAGPLLAGLVGYAAGILTAAWFAALAAGAPGGAAELLALAIGRVMEVTGGEAPSTEELRRRFLLMPALAAVSWVVMIVTNGALAQGLLARFGRNLRPGPDIAAIEAPRWAAPFLAVSAVVAAFAPPDGLGALGMNVGLVLLVPFLFLGLAVVHTLARRTGSPHLVLGLVYASCLILTLPAVAVVAIGLVEPVLRLRRRFGGAGGGPPAGGQGEV